MRVLAILTVKTTVIVMVAIVNAFVIPVATVALSVQAAVVFESGFTISKHKRSNKNE